MLGRVLLVRVGASEINMSNCRNRRGQFARCTSGLRNADPDDPIFPPGLDWNRVGRKFADAHDKWHKGLREYSEVMAEIEGYSKLGGPQYREVVRLAQRGQETASRLMDQRSAIQDDLYEMYGKMPRPASSVKF